MTLPKLPTDCNPIVSLRDVGMRYDNDWILRNINLDICRGDFLAVSGPNGGGKTTLLKLILKLIKPMEGIVTYFSTSDKSTNELSIGYLPQKSAIDLHFPISVREMVLSGLIKGWGLKMPGNAKSLLADVTEMLGLSSYLDSQIGSISGGQLQRALMARAIISNPELVVLDEPLSYVDKHFEQQIYSLVEDINKKATIILVSHEMTVISHLANKHIIVNRSVEECHSHHHGPQASLCP